MAPEVAPGKTGEGSAIKVSLFDGMAEWMTVPLLHHDYGPGAPARVGLNHPSIAPYGAYAAKDGQLILISIQNEREWQRFCADVLGDAALASHPLFKDNVTRVKNRPELDARIAAVFGAQTADDLTARLKAAQIAKQVGYRSEAAFSRKFAKHFGTTPSGMRELAAAQAGPDAPISLFPGRWSKKPSGESKSNRGRHAAGARRSVPFVGRLRDNDE